MVDEDFVMGYVCGYNDGIGSGGGGSEKPWIVISKAYKFGDSGYGIGLFDYRNTPVCRNRQGFQSWAVDYSSPNRHYIPGPLNSGTYEWGYAAMQGDKVIGYCLSGISIANDRLNWTHVNGVWEMQSPVYPTFKSENIVAVSPGTKYSSYDIEYYVEGEVSEDSEDSSYSYFLFGIQKNPNNGKALAWTIRHSSYFFDVCSGDDMLGWFTALCDNGITI